MKNFSEDIQQCTEKSSSGLVSAILTPFCLITVLLATVSVILGVVVYRLKVSLKEMKIRLNETETKFGVQTVEMEKISEYASVSIDVKAVSTSRHHQVSL